MVSRCDLQIDVFGKLIARRAQCSRCFAARGNSRLSLTK